MNVRVVRYDRPGGVRQAVARALTRAIHVARTRTGRALAADTGLKKGFVDDRLGVSEASAERLTATLSVQRRRIRLIDFGARQTKKGVTSRLRGGTKTIPGAFIVPLGGRPAVAMRVSPSRSRSGLPRSSPGLPIRQLYGPSLLHVALKPGIREDVLVAAREAFVKNAAHELSRAFR